MLAKARAAVCLVDPAVGSRDDGDADGFGQFPGLHFTAHQRNGVRGGTDEGDACGMALPGEPGIFGKKSVPRVNGVGTNPQGKVDDLPPIQESFHRSRANDIGFVGLLDVDPG